MWACSLIQGMINVNCLQKFPYLELDFAKESSRSRSFPFGIFHGIIWREETLGVLSHHSLFFCFRRNNFF